MQLKKTDVALKSSEYRKMEKVVINGVAYQRPWKKDHSQHSWIRSDLSANKVMPVTQPWIDRKRGKTRNADLQIVARFPRLKREFLYDGTNLTWKNAPRFNPEKIDDTEWLIDLFIADKSINLIYAPE